MDLINREAENNMEKKASVFTNPYVIGFLFVAVGLSAVAWVGYLASSSKGQVGGKSGNSSTAQHQTRQRLLAIDSGATYCLSSRSMSKVRAIAMAGNQYASLPGDCEIASRPIPVEVVGQDALGFSIVRSNGGSAYVQQSDLSYQ